MLSSNIGISVVIFLAIAIVLIATLCLITRYFNNKLQKALNDDNEVYSMIEEIRGSPDGEKFEEYTQNIYKRENLEKSSSKKHEPFEIEMDDVRQPLGQPEDIYGTSKLKRRLEGADISVQVSSPLSKRSTGTIRSFRAERIDSERTNNSNRLRVSNDDEDVEESGRTSRTRSQRDKKKSNFVTYTFINKIVAYNGEGINIVENKVVSLIKTEEKIEEKKSIATLVVRPEQSSFEDTLEVHGFEKNIYGAYKYEVTVEIPHMKMNEKYPVASLKCSESKSELEFPEFYHIKSTFESG